MKKRVISFIWVLCISNAYAEFEGNPSTAAGIVERQMEQEYNIRELSPTKEVPILEVDVPEEILDIPKGIKVKIDKVVVKGNRSLSQTELDAITSQYENQELTGRDVQNLCYDVQDLYNVRGYIVAWVYPPVQKIEQGVLIIEVLEGTLDSVQVIGNSSYKASYIRGFFKALVGESINHSSLLKALLLVNENRDLQVEGVLKKGAAVGGVDLILKIEDSRPYGLSLGYNNWGSADITYNQMYSEASMGNLATSGDLLTVMTSFGIPPVFFYISPSYSVPVNASGGKLNLSFMYSNSNTQVFTEFNLVGTSQVGTVAYTQPFIRTRSFDLDFLTSFDIKQMRNLELGETTTFDKLRVLNLGAQMNYIDSVQGRNYFSGFFHAGIPYFLGGDAPINPKSSREGSGSRYFILNMNFQRLQPIFEDQMFVMTSSAQGTFNKIPLPEQFFLGGMGTIRGYEAAVAVGDVGYFVNFEWYIPPPWIKDKEIRWMKQTWKEALQLFAFIDHGGIYTIDPVPEEASSAYLASVGVGLRFYGPRNLSLGFDAGFPVMKQYKQYNSILYVRFGMDFL